jgi:hypothetical protein
LFRLRRWIGLGRGQHHPCENHCRSRNKGDSPHLKRTRYLIWPRKLPPTSNPPTRTS